MQHVLAPTFKYLARSFLLLKKKGNVLSKPVQQVYNLVVFEKPSVHQSTTYI